MKRFVICLVTCVVASGVLASTASASKEFLSPSHNIGCVLSGKFVRCDIAEHSYPTPPKPHPCFGDYEGNVVVVDTDEHDAVVSCASDSTLDPAFPVLAYGDRIENRHFRCTSKSKGMRCVNLQTKHGFFLSRDDLRLF
jgi:hypothetical protein